MRLTITTYTALHAGKVSLDYMNMEVPIRLVCVADCICILQMMQQCENAHKMFCHRNEYVYVENSRLGIA